MNKTAMRDFAVRYAEIRDRIDDLYGELTVTYPSSPDWIRITREIDEAVKDLRAAAVDWQDALRGES